MDAPGDKPHDGQMLDHQPLLFGGEPTWPRGKHICRRTAQRLGLHAAARLLRESTVWKWTDEFPERTWGFVICRILKPTVQRLGNLDRGSPNGHWNVERFDRDGFYWTRPSSIESRSIRARYPYE